MVKMSFDYYYRDHLETEVIIQAVGSLLSVRVADDEQNALIHLPVEEIDRMIAGLNRAKLKILSHQSSHTKRY
jgi:hypothetical protein